MTSQKQPNDMTTQAGGKGDEEATRVTRQAELDESYDESGSANTPSPEGDDAGENRVTTSLSDD